MTTFTPVPKPQPRTEAERLATRIANANAREHSQRQKQLQKKLNEKIIFAAPHRKRAPRPSQKPIAKRKPVVKINRRRRKSEFARSYGSRARVAWVKGLPCLVRREGNCAGTIDNAHTKTGGMGRKADASTIVPLCQKHHRILHNAGAETFQILYRVSLEHGAFYTQQQWLVASRGAE